MTHTLTIYFLGRYRPAHFEAESLHLAHDAAVTAIADVEEPMRAKLKAWLWEAVKAALGNCTGWQAEHGGFGVSWAPRAHDPWLDDLTALCPLCPGLAYPA